MRAIKLLFCHIPFAVMIAKCLVLCSPVTNSLNDNLISYAVKEEDDNSTNVKTLQKENFGRYANFAPIRNPIRFKEIPDNAISGSSHSRGLLHHDHDHSGYNLHDYGDDPHHAYGYEYHIHDDHHGDYHLPDYPDHHHGGHHHVGHGHGHHHKHFNPALAAKAVLWPIAGIALLGVATAALVTNPVLLQLGVISGKRRRRDTKSFNYEHNFDIKSLKEWSKTDAKRDQINFDETNQKRDSFYGMLKKRMARRERQKVLSPKAHLTEQSSIETVTLDAQRHNNEDFNEKIFIPVPLLSKGNRKFVKKD